MTTVELTFLAVALVAVLLAATSQWRQNWSGLEPNTVKGLNQRNAMLIREMAGLQQRLTSLEAQIADLRRENAVLRNRLP